MGRILFSAGLAASRSEGHRLVVKGGAYIGSGPAQAGGMRDEVKFTPVVEWDPAYTPKFVLEGNILLLRRAKHNVKTVQIISDQEFEERGLDCPGWKEWKESHTVVDPDEKAEKERLATSSKVRRMRRQRAPFTKEDEDKLLTVDGELSSVKKVSYS